MGGTACCFSSLVRVVPLAELQSFDIWGSYAIVMKGKACSTVAGCRGCDFTDGTVSFYRPERDTEGKTFCNEIYVPQHNKDTEGWAVLFSKELLCCSEGGWKPDDFSFFGYSYKESLHVSCREKETLGRCAADIKDEMEWGVDRYSCRLILRKIEMLLIYCKRFYDRQFLTRNEACHCIMRKIDSAIDSHIQHCHCAEATPCAIGRIAKDMQMSTAYLNDYVLFSKGFTMKEYFLNRQACMAKDFITHTTQPFADIARDLGLGTTQRMSVFVQKVFGLTPNELRNKA